MSNVRLINRDMDILMPPSVDEGLARRHLAQFIVNLGQARRISLK